MIHKFEKHLIEKNLAHSSITSYVRTVNYFLQKYGEVSKHSLLDFKEYLVDNCSATTVNQRLQAINKYLEYIRLDTLKLKFVKVQQKNYLENVISNADYVYLKKKLKADMQDKWYFVVWFLTATGARVSELLKIKVEDVQIGYLDIYSYIRPLKKYISKNQKVQKTWIKAL